jgi:hypothetical protein
VGEPAPFPLAGVWAAPDEVFAVGFRGTVRRRVGDAWIADRIDPTVDLHGVVGLGGGRAFAVGGELLGGAPRGTILYRSVDRLSPAIVPDREPADMTVPRDLAVADLARDLGASDGGATDGAADLVTTDLALTDGALIPAGKMCPLRGGCVETAECWFIMGSGYYLCTERCATPLDCGDRYGPDPQCAPPGCQALSFRRCLPRAAVGCAFGPVDLGRPD